ncbi:bifunctional phosphopantothenoylcysteine decarboxylase/phosphopantothenate--cysteine ligase CoaBC [Acetobacteraceae bacterium ESL0709]|nr:bifunctional phosphopantothenoylcysteine decarboxylase/phosphopantothenate--cysteine ligase CoaBC [Acetobacteraceae bacterium ESL0697]MDF7678147.1 bifunctional phosphopantothenoylcysteine decarboxylase/phosphopantothenate--cysteine ligase CoaBC [Acetobacteraceae bacterium ESL0709]
MTREDEVSGKKRILLVIGGGIAAFKALEVARLLRKKSYGVTPVMTEAAQAFVTKLSVETLCGEAVYSDLLSADQESRISHIALARSADIILVCPATANLLARMAHGLADDLATTVLLATTAPIYVAPAMNVRMWENPATQANRVLLEQRGVHFIGPVEGEMACGEFGMGRLASPEMITDILINSFARSHLLQGRHFLVTAGPTCEPIDPVRYISNHSSGLQGFAIAEALAQAGAAVTLISGPVSLPTPANVRRINVVTARDMLEATLSCLPVDGMIAVAAVSDWRTETEGQEKLKKGRHDLSILKMVENPDILAMVCHHDKRPALVVGFAAETEKLLEHAREKRLKKGCDWLLANDVKAGVFGKDHNQVSFLDDHGVENWPSESKKDIACRLVQKISTYFHQI